jgi:hypothetical protein
MGPAYSHTRSHPRVFQSDWGADSPLSTGTLPPSHAQHSEAVVESNTQVFKKNDALLTTYVPHRHEPVSGQSISSVRHAAWQRPQQVQSPRAVQGMVHVEADHSRALKHTDDFRVTGFAYALLDSSQNTTPSKFIILHYQSSAHPASLPAGPAPRYEIWVTEGDFLNYFSTVSATDALSGSMNHPLNMDVSHLQQMVPPTMTTRSPFIGACAWPPQSPARPRFHCRQGLYD